VLEVEVVRAIRGADLPRPCFQFEVVIEGTPYRLDLAWPDHRVAVECDGFSAHGRDRFEQDRTRRAALVAADWHVIPVTWVEITRFAPRFLAVLGRALAEEPEPLHHRVRPCDQDGAEVAWSVLEMALAGEDHREA
jgi:very-short-patch-repair endonuclease